MTPKEGKPELQFMCSAICLMVFNICMKFHENMSSCFKVMERTQKLLTDTYTQRKDGNYIPPWHTLYAGGIKTKLYIPMVYFICQGYKNLSKGQ